MNTVLSAQQAAALHGQSAVRNKIERGMWQRPCRGVVVTHNGPLSPEEHLAVALASAPPGSALAGPTALQLDGFSGFEDPRIHIVVPGHARHPSLPKLVVHVSNELSDLDVHPSRSPRRTRAPRSVVDHASWQPNERKARAIVIAAVQQGIVTTRLLREALLRRGPCRHRALLREAMLDVDGGVQSLPERDFSLIWSHLRLPHLSRQRKIRRRDGSYFLDTYCDELGFGAEIHGAPHLAVEQWDRDLLRANEITAKGERLLFFTSHAIRHAPDAVAAQLLDMARASGWPAPTNPPTFTSLSRHKRRTFRDWDD